MEGISLRLEENNKDVVLTIKPGQVKGRVDAQALHNFVKNSEYANFFIMEDAIASAASSLKIAQQASKNNEIIERVAERRDAIARFAMDEDEMKAYLSITAPNAGKHITISDLNKLAKDAGIVRGLSRKRMQLLLAEVKQVAPGGVVEDLVAKGLPARHGKNSRVVPLVPNALERILRPQRVDESKVDMRNLGEIICVKAGTPISRRLPPTLGRDGYTVTNTPLESQQGQWVAFKPGSGTKLSDTDENLLLSEINGMPKFKNEQMWVDDTFICKGCNVGTGNINYDGAVLVNGDVTEKMKIVATGDVTINGFVDSATIQAGGDIIITEGAMGKVNEANTEFGTSLIAQGSVHVQHGQGLDIMCNGNVTIGRQLAYSRIVCRGSVIVGPVDNPNGNLFACEIQSQDAIRAGTLGAVSGSTLSIDFSSGFNMLVEKKEQLDEMVQQIQRNFKRHEDKIAFIKSKKIPAELADKVIEAVTLYNNEKQLMEWLEEKALQMKKAKEQYTEEIGLFATQRLYPGVVVKLNNRTWRAEREYPKAKIHYYEHQWQYEPIY
ncbi:DUF342 domain-containing protein [Paraneptunicella aestuarii]|uniref:DUF342 domain-containing protein n=1 Tax=Paraneptunicella aestuarii TaxID=2831148 RepID=UPI001E464D47|nr:FapA family protein [Paraneptunicella aestuarii]UAA37240.1 DUF342 domain-containing protein [Paraneptunicella aestuarii]